MSDWRDHQLLVLSKLDKLESLTEKIHNKQHDHDKEIDRLKVKSGFFGLIGGVLTTLALKLGSAFFPHN